MPDSQPPEKRDRNPERYDVLVDWPQRLAYEGPFYRHLFEAGGARRVLDCVRAGRERGILFDIGHGVGSFDWQVARAATEQGFWPDVISTDLHRYCIDGPVFDLPTTITKLLYLGMPLGAVIAATTARPAAAIGRSDTLGRLAPGAPADVSVLEAVGGNHPLTDVNLHTETAATRLVPRWTVRNGLLCEGRERPASA